MRDFSSAEVLKLIGDLCYEEMVVTPSTRIRMLKEHPKPIELIKFSESLAKDGPAANGEGIAKVYVCLRIEFPKTGDTIELNDAGIPWYDCDDIRFRSFLIGNCIMAVNSLAEAGEITLSEEIKNLMEENSHDFLLASLIGT